MLKELVSKFKPEDKPVEIKFGPVSVEVDERTYNKIISLMYPLKDTESNLALAKRAGVKPISTREIISQIKRQDLDRAVLFDTPPNGFSAGNHWRILKVDNKQETATLQYCGTFGNHDYDLVPPIIVPLDTPLFTGISLQYYELGGLPATLGEVVKAVEESSAQSNTYPKSLKSSRETILWSNPEGLLVKSEQHLTFQKT